MKPTRQDVIAAVRAAFPRREPDVILCMLDLYGVESYERERERVQLAILSLCGADEERLLEFVHIAKVDCRDILCWASTGALSQVEGEKLRQAARRLIEAWGRD